MRDLSSYALSPLRHGDFALYRGSGKGLPPILLVTAGNASLAYINRLEHEYALRADLDSAWAAHPIELVRHRNRLALVLEDPGGAVLDRLLGQPLGITDFLRIGISLAWALRQVHARGLIHKDIKPANILADVASSGVWLTGFGIASRLPRERPNPEPPNEIAGTLAYIAPEQTGRMNRSIDARSDLYSLGVTFYEMLTGTLPFTAADPMEWVHCHIARRAVPPDERTLETPGVLSVITMKLLAKTADERYQTAAGIEADLRRCLAEWESHGRIDPFPLGAHDASDRLLIPEQLYGREREIEMLLACFDRVVAHGTPELVLVSGFSGIGKSSVVHELHKVLVQPRGLYASGKFDQYKRDIPYVTLAQAFQSLVRPLLSQGEVELGRWRDSFSEALGSNGQLIVDLVPELELIIGKQPTVPDLPPQEAKNRFQRVFRRFLGVFARKEHPLALFLDDLQWLDSATLDLLEHLVTHSEVRHLLLVGAYRDNEVGPSHPLIRTLEAIRETDARVQEIVLGPLGLDDVGRLLADALHCEPERVRTLAELVDDKTGGNPFFAIQFLIALYDEGLLAFDSVAAVWAWDINHIDAKNYTDNVVDLMVRKLKRLSITTQDALKHLACLGHMTEIGTLSTVYQQTEEAMHEALRESVRAGLIIHQGDSYKFLHDRIQQAAYSLFPEERRAAVHLRIGRKLLANLTAEEITEQLFEVANQFNRGGTLIVDRDEKEQVATINLRTGRKAKASTAYASARVYFSAGMALLDEKDWGNQYELTFCLWLERAECELLSGNFETAEQLIAELSQRGTSKVDQAAVCRLKIQLHEVKGECVQGVDSALRCLRLFGIDLPAQPTWERVQAEYETVWSNLKGRPIEDLIDLPLMSDREIQAAMQVLSTLLSSAYFTDLHLNCLHLCRMLNLSMQHGVSGASAHACGWLGVILGHVFHRYQEGYRFAKLACDLAEKHGFIADKAKILESRGLAAFWTQPLANAIDFNRAALRAATESGDLNYACYFMHEFVEFLLQENRPLEEVWYESQRALDFARKAKFRDVADLIASQQHFIATMQLRTAPFSTFSAPQSDEVAFEAQLTGDRMPMLTGWYWILKTKARFLSGDYAGALTAAGKAKALLWTTVGEPMVLDYFYYTALTVAACYEKASVDQQQEWRALLTAHLEQLREWTDNYPPTFADKHALVSGEVARLEGRDGEAMRLYEQAIKSAREHGFVQNEGLAHEVAAGFYAARGVENIAYTYLRNARDCYLRWGALGKVQQLDQRHPGLREKVALSALSATVSAPVEQLDVGTVVKASQAVSSEIELGKLIETLMRVSLEHAGAERGLLILLRGDEPRIEAEATSRGGHVEVTLRQAAVSPAELPESVLHTAVRTRESVILEDASAQIPFSEDAYVRQKRARSVLCLPLVKQAKLVGAVYLENNLTPHAFPTGRIAVLELVASQAAISLENAALYVALKESEEQWRDVFENNPIMYFMIDAAGMILAANPFGAEQLGYRVDELVGQPVQRIIYASDREPVEGHLAHCLEQLGHVKGWEARKVCKDGTVLWVRETGKAVPRVNGAIILLACEDITVRRHFEAERERLQAQLRQSQKMEAIGTLAGGIAHDFNNILGAILGYGELAQQSVAADSDVHRYLSNVMQAGGRAKSLVERILAFSRRGASEVGPVNVQAVVDETLELLAATSLAPTVRIERHLDAADAAVVGDATQLHQVVMNLCTNALQAMENGGLLEVRLDQVYAKQDISLSHGTVAPGSFVRICIADTGGGIPGHVLDRIFDPFFTTKSVGEGTGLGLSMVHGIVAGLGGAIDVRTMIGAGTTFTIWLPRAGEAVVPSAEPASHLPHGNGETVLIVDNEKILVALAEEILAELGYEPVGFSSSSVALGAFRDSPQRFDIVLTDEWMPELVGTDLASEIARLRPDLPIVLMSGFGGAHLHERARAVGIRELLRKPLRRRDIAECFDRILRE